MNGLDYRLREFLPALERRAVLLDASAGLSLGVVPGLEDWGQAVRPALAWLDGLICSPGQLRRLTNCGRADAALLVRMDWTNTLRGEGFPLAPETATHLAILTTSDALELGATAMVSSLLLGYDETLEAGCVKAMVQLAMAGRDLGLPLIVDVCPSGPRVALPDKAVELGASLALESGADVIGVPYAGSASLKTIAAMLSVPWLLKPTTPVAAAREWEEALGLGAAGLWLDHTWLAPSIGLKQFADRARQAAATGD